MRPRVRSQIRGFEPQRLEILEQTGSEPAPLPAFLVSLFNDPDVFRRRD
jgi:hypothetical protein